MGKNKQEAHAGRDTGGGKKQDIRIVQLRNYDQPFRRTCDSGEYRFQAFAYFDTLEVFPKPGSPPCGTLGEGYGQIKRRLRTGEWEEYRSQQLILAFRDCEDGEQAAVESFWAQKAPLFFMTMVNIPLRRELAEAEEWVNEVFRGTSFQLYATFDFSELLIFYKGSSFREYAGLIMKLNYGKPENPITDTITVCSFSSNGEALQADELVDLYLRIGVEDYQKATGFLRAAFPTATPEWLLGRNDLALWLPGTPLDKLYQVYKDYAGGGSAWATTVNASISVPPVEPVEPGKPEEPGKPGEPEGMAGNEGLKAEYQALRCRLEQEYQTLCKLLKVQEDETFLRIFYDVAAQIQDAQANRLSEDLAVCLWPQYTSFIDYLGKARVRLEQERSKGAARWLEESIGAFYVNVMALVNSTVHGRRQFIQIPHCGVTAFEMPAKMMAYYQLMANQIVDVLRDNPCFYGVMIAPKLVTGLGVDPLALNAVTGLDQMRSVSICEAMFYEPRQTVAVLAHEIAHFVGEKARCRTARLREMCGYAAASYLFEILEEYGRFLNVAEDALDGSGDVLREYALALRDGILDKLFPEGWENDPPIMAEAVRRFGKIPSVLFNTNLQETVFSTVIFPEQGAPLFQEALAGMAGQPQQQLGIGAERFRRRLLKAKAKAAFNDAFKCYHARWQARQNRPVWDTDPLDWAAYLFSEAYADLCMVLLFDMESRAYLNLMAASKTRDAQELIRYVAVVDAMAAAGKWPKPEEAAEPEEADGDPWRALLKQFRAAILSREDGLWEQAVEAAGEAGAPDNMILSFLTPYLDACLKVVESQLREKKTPLEELRTCYREVDPDSSARKALGRIMQMEKERLPGQA